MRSENEIFMAAIREKPILPLSLVHICPLNFTLSGIVSIQDLLFMILSGDYPFQFFEHTVLLKLKVVIPLNVIQDYKLVPLMWTDLKYQTQ